MALTLDSLSTVSTSLIGDNSITSTKIVEGAITSAKIQSSATSTLAGPKISNVQYANVTFHPLDDLAANIGGGYCVVNGSGFQSGAVVKVGTTTASPVTRVNSNTLRVTLPAKSTGSHDLTLYNPDGSIAILVNGLTYGDQPLWVTASPFDNQSNATFFSISLNATSDSNVTYALQTGSTLPSGLTLESNGYLSGTVTVEAETTYSFTLEAIDEELQDTPKTFSVTVTVVPQVALYTWGSNSAGELGLNDTVGRSSPTQVGSDVDWNIITIGETSVLAIKTDNTLWSWGYNDRGQLGHNDVDSRSSPTQVGAGTDWSYVFCDMRNTLALKTDKTLWAWGRNNTGQLGLNGGGEIYSPTQVGSSTDWELITTSRYVSMAIKTNGTLWLWGRNNYGQLGLGDTVSKSSPVQIGSDTDWVKISLAVRNHPGVIKSDGTLWMTGENANGGLGLNDRTNRSTFTKIGTDTNWSFVACGDRATSAIKTDGTLWAWGRNDYGKLGLNDGIYRSSPTQVGVDNDWVFVRMSDYTTSALKSDGTLWMWGGNGGGALGNESTVHASSPIQIGTNNNWANVSAFYSSVATKIL